MFFPSLAPADVIHGTIKVEEAHEDEAENGEPSSSDQPEMANVKISCESETKSKSVRIPGEYKLTMSKEGPCTFTISYRQQTMETDVISTDQPMRFNFVIAEQDDGKYSLEQR